MIPVTDQERADLATLAELDRRPSASQRVARSTGQGGLAYVALDAAEAFRWFGAQDWSPEQTKAAMALAFAVIAAVQNAAPVVGRFVAGWWKARHP